MLIKVGDYRINLTRVLYVTVSELDGVLVEVVFPERVIPLKNKEAEQLLDAWDKWAQFQNDAQEINEFAVAENLKQVRQAQNKSGIVAPVAAMPLLKRGRG